mmetsp:Transcript_2261/g.5091  ORF Transcript_2261/g.5091 Transcript_2261/m.5091 type:complete len:179 (-) Transcript_2261:88-624(-)
MPVNANQTVAEVHRTVKILAEEVNRIAYDLLRKRIRPGSNAGAHTSARTSKLVVMPVAKIALFDRAPLERARNQAFYGSSLLQSLRFHTKAVSTAMSKADLNHHLTQLQKRRAFGSTELTHVETKANQKSTRINSSKATSKIALSPPARRAIFFGHQCLKEASLQGTLQIERAQIFSQ